MASSAPIPWKHIRNVLVLFAPLWIGAALLFGMFSGAFALLSKSEWSARQPLVVRDEASSSVARLGRFASQTELKAAQETILEMTRNPEVVSAALQELGPPQGHRGKAWPTSEVVDAVANSSVNLVAPKGSEFGNTEVVYLQVKAGDPARAASFCGAMFHSLTQQLRRVRRVRADSIIEELAHSRDLAERELDEAAERIHQIEVQFGSDLADLRGLTDTFSGDSSNRRSLEKTTGERQSAELERNNLETLHALLVAGAEDPQRLLVSGGDLLASQPSLARLKEGLIDAQLAASQLSGVYTKDNPKHRAAVAAEAEITRRIRQEAAAVSRAMEPALQLARARVARLQSREAELRDNLQELAKARIAYAKADAEVKNRTLQLSEAEKSLSEATASRSAALSTNLIAQLGPPQVSDGPIGPGGMTLTAAGGMAGLIFGLGAVFLIAPGPSEVRSGRRWTDYLGNGRRASDREQPARDREQVGGDRRGG